MSCVYEICSERCISEIKEIFFVFHIMFLHLIGWDKIQKAFTNCQLIRRIQDMINQRSETRLIHIIQEANNYANALARMGTQQSHRVVQLVTM